MKNKRWMSVILIFIVILICAVTLFGCGNKYKKNPKVLPVMIWNNENIEIDGLDYKVVEYGAPVEFSFTAKEGYRCKTDEGVLFYNNGIYTLKINEVTSPIVITISTELHNKLEYTTSDHLFSLSTPNDFIETNGVNNGEKVRIQTQASNASTFLCWSTGGTIENGGSVLSYYDDYAFIADTNTTIFANYVNVESGKKYIEYQLNGGKILNSNTISFFTEAKSEYHLRYNTDTGIDAFRDGYSLVAWNTSPDGTGERIGLGSRVTVNSGILTLYAMWEEWTDISMFDFIIGDYDVLVTKCYSEDESVVMPSLFGPYDSINIAPGAFDGLTNLNKLVLPNDIKRIDSGAFIDCTSLTDLIFSDNIEYFTDDAFINTSPKYLFVNAVRKPTNLEIFGYKILDNVDRVLLSDKPNLILQGGSSSAYGFDSGYLEGLLDGEYNVTNFGWNAYRPMAFLMGITAHITKENDVYVHAGEIDFALQYGTDTFFLSTLWGMLEGNYDILSWVDISIMDFVFDTYTEYNESRNSLPIKSYDEYNYYDIRGDAPGFRSNNEVKPKKRVTLDSSVFSESGFEVLNGYYSQMQNKGVKVYESFGTIMKDVVRNNESSLLELENILRTNLVCPLISKLTDYLFSYCYFDYDPDYENIYHLSTEGAIIRTEKLVADLLRQWEKESD